MAKPNYAFEKRQREIAKKKKKEEKRLLKAAEADDQTQTDLPISDTDDQPVKTEVDPFDITSQK